MTCYEFNTGQLSFPNSIQFYATIKNKKIEVMRFTGDGVWANPDVAVDETAKAVLDALDLYVKALVRNAVAEEREACAKLCEEKETYGDPVQCWLDDCAASIRARGNQ